MPYFEMFVFLLLQTYCLQVADSDVIHNEMNSSGHNISLAEETTDLIDEDLRLNFTQIYDKNVNGLGFTKHVSKEKHRRHKAKQIHQLPNVNTSAADEEDITQVRSMKRSLNTVDIRKMGINKERTCEALVLTYGPIGFTSALELIGNASGGHDHSLDKKYDPSTSSGSNIRGKISKRMVHIDPAVVFSSPEEYVHVNAFTARELNVNRHGYKSGEGNREKDEIVQVKLPDQKIRDKQRAETIIGDSVQVFGYGNEQIVKENEALGKEKIMFVIDGSDKTQDENKYSVLRLLLKQNLSGFYLPGGDETEQSSDSLPITSRRKMKYSKPLFNSNDSASLSTKYTNTNKNKKSCPKQPKFIDKITIDKGNYKNIENVTVKRRGIDTKYALEHFRAKAKLIEEDIPNYGEKKVDNKNDETVTLLDLEDILEDKINQSVESANIKQKTVQRRYIPQLHPMPETEDDKNKETVSADYLMVGGSNKFNGKTTDEIRKELVDHFHKWPKTREWLHSDRNTNINENEDPTKINLPIRIYESSPGYGDLYLENLGSSEMYQNTKINKNNEPSNIKLPIRIYESSSPYDNLYLENLGSAETYDRNMQDPQQEPEEIFLYIDNTSPHEFVPEPPFQYKLFHEEDSDNYNTPFNPENNQHAMAISNTNEADYYPIDYQYLLKKDEYPNGYLTDPTDHNAPIFQQNEPEYGYDETRPLDVPILYETDQHYSSSDCPQSIVSALEKITESKEESKPKIKIFKVHLKPTDILERNTNQKKETIGCKTRVTAHSRKKKPHRKCRD